MPSARVAQQRQQSNGSLVSEGSLGVVARFGVVFAEGRVHEVVVADVFDLQGGNKAKNQKFRTQSNEIEQNSAERPSGPVGQRIQTNLDEAMLGHRAGQEAIGNAAHA